MNKSAARMVVLALVVAVGALAQEPQVDPVRAADHDALRALRAKVVDAVNKRDMKALRNCFAREFAFTGVDQSVITSEADLQAYNTRMFEGSSSPLSSLTVNPEATILTKFFGSDAGYCYGTSKDTYTLKKGMVVPITSNWTATVVREDGEWKVAAGHAGVNLLDNPVLSRTASFGMKIGAGGLALGLILGLFFGWLIGRRKKA